MGLLLGPETEYAKEMRKWESFPTQYGPPGRTYRFQEFPKRLYRAEHQVGKGIVIADAQTAADEHEERNLLSRGFVFGQDKAIEAAERQQTDYGKLAAEREWEIQHNRLSERAVSEVRAAEADYGTRHLPAVPEQPIRRKAGRPKKAVETVEPSA